MLGLAVLLMVAWGMSGLFDKDSRSGDGATVATAFGEKISVKEIRGIISRMQRVVYARQLSDSNDVMRYLPMHIAKLHAARQAGLHVSDAEAKQSIRDDVNLRRASLIEYVYVEHSDYFDKAAASRDEVTAYYNDHREEYDRPLDEIFEVVEEAVRYDKASASARADVAVVRSAAREATRFKVKTALKDDARAHELKYGVGYLYDAPGGLENASEMLAKSEELEAGAFDMRVGLLSQIYQTGDATFFCRIFHRSAGFDRDGVFHKLDVGWDDEKGVFDQLEEFSLSTLVKRRYDKLPLDEYEKALRERILVNRLDAWVAPAALLTDSILKARYMLEAEELQARFLSLDIFTETGRGGRVKSDFFGAIPEDEGAISTYFNKHKDVVSTASDSIGYKLPAMIRVEYVAADTVTMAGKIRPNPAQVRAYYEQHKDDEFKLEDATGPGQYERFEDVKREIEATLRTQQAQEQAKKIVELLTKVTVQANVTGDPELAKLAKEYGFTYGVTPFFGQRQMDLAKLPSPLNGDREFMGTVFAASPDGTPLMHTPESWLEEVENRRKASEGERAQVSSRRLFSSVMGPDRARYFFRVVDQRDSKAYGEYQELVDMAQMDIDAFLKEDLGLDLLPGGELGDAEYAMRKKELEEEQAQARELLEAVKTDWKLDKATDLATESLGRLRRDAAAKAFESFAAANGLAVQVSEPFTGDVLPAKIDDIRPLARALGEALAGTLSPIVEHEGMCYLAIIEKAEADMDPSVEAALAKADELLTGYGEEDEAGRQTLLVRYLEFDAAALIEEYRPSDDDLDDCFSRDPGKYEAFLPETGKATIEYAVVRLEEGNAEAADKLIAALRSELEQLPRTDGIETLANKHKDGEVEFVSPEEFLLSKAAEVPGIGEAEGFAEQLDEVGWNQVSEVLKTSDARFVFRVKQKESPKAISRRERSELNEEGRQKLLAGLLAAWDAEPPRRKAMLLFSGHIARAMDAAVQENPIEITTTVEHGRGSVSSWNSFSLLSPPRELRNQDGTVEAIMALNPGELSDIIEIRFTPQSAPQYYIVHMDKKEQQPNIKLKMVRIAPGNIPTPMKVEGEGEQKQQDEKTLMAAAAGQVHQLVVAGKSLDEAVRELAGLFTPGRLPIVNTTAFFSENQPLSIMARHQNVKDAAFALENEGDYTPVVETTAGLFIAQLLEKKETTEATAGYVRIRPYDLQFQSEATDAQVEAYFNENKEDYRNKTSYKLEVLSRSESDYALKLELSDEQVKQYYEDHKEEFWRVGQDEPAQYRPLEDVEFDVKIRLRRELAKGEMPKAFEGAREKWLQDGGPSASEIAREYLLDYESTDPLPQGVHLTSRDHPALADVPDLWDTLSSMKEGDVTQALTGRSHTALVRVVEISGGDLPEFNASVKIRAARDLAAKLAEERAPKVAAAYRETLVRKLKESEEADFVQIAESTPMTVERGVAVKTGSTGYFGSGWPYSTGRGTYIPGLRAQLKTVALEAFKLVPGTMSDVLREPAAPRACYVLVWRDSRIPNAGNLDEDAQRFRQHFQRDIQQNDVSKWLNSIESQVQFVQQR